MFWLFSIIDQNYMIFKKKNSLCLCSCVIFVFRSHGNQMRAQQYSELKLHMVMSQLVLVIEHESSAG